MLPDTFTVSIFFWGSLKYSSYTPNHCFIKCKCQQRARSCSRHKQSWNSQRIKNSPPNLPVGWQGSNAPVSGQSAEQNQKMDIPRNQQTVSRRRRGRLGCNRSKLLCSKCCACKRLFSVVKLTHTPLTFIFTVVPWVLSGFWRILCLSLWMQIQWKRLNSWAHFPPLHWLIY